jgi:tRNA (cytidine/uridine-2'-O-)-methyltransferase
VHIIEPAGFPTTDRLLRRAGMDYLDRAAIVRHASWHAFEGWRRAAHASLILLTTQSRLSYLDHQFRDGDVLLFGRETSGAPEDVHRSADTRLIIPMQPGMRSLNVAVAAAMVVGEALRQTERERSSMPARAGSPHAQIE